MLVFLPTARPIEALPYVKGCLLFVGWALRSAVQSLDKKLNCTNRKVPFEVTS